MAHQPDKPIKLAGNMRLRHGQIIGTAPTIATKSTKAKQLGAHTHHAMGHVEDGAYHVGMSKTTSKALDGADYTTPKGRVKCGTCAPDKPGMRRDRSKPIG